MRRLEAVRKARETADRQANMASHAAADLIRQVDAIRSGTAPSAAKANTGQAPVALKRNVNAKYSTSVVPPPKPVSPPTASATSDADRKRKQSKKKGKSKGKGKGKGKGKDKGGKSKGKAKGGKAKAKHAPVVPVRIRSKEDAAAITEVERQRRVDEAAAEEAADEADREVRTLVGVKRGVCVRACMVCVVVVCV